MIGRKGIEEFKNYVDRFRWENYTREFRHELSNLKQMYWHIVLLDYCDSTFGSEVSGRLNDFGLRVYKTFMGCYYKPHVIITKFEERLEGFSKLYIDANRQYWKEWKSELTTNRDKNFTLLNELIHQNLSGELITKGKAPALDFDISSFDKKHKNMGQVISSLLYIHLKVTRYGPVKTRNPIQNFPLSVKPELIDLFHSYMEDYFKAQFTCSFLNKFESSLSDKPFKIIRAENIKQAIESLLERYPDFNKLSRSEFIEFVHLYCKDEDGKQFNKSSVRAYLKRQG